MTTKLWPGNAAWGQTPKTTETTITSLDESLARLGLDICRPLPHPRTVRPRAAPRPVARPRRAQGAEKGTRHRRQQLQRRAPGGARRGGPAADRKPTRSSFIPWSQKPELVRYLNEHGIVPIAYSSLVPLSTWRTAPATTAPRRTRCRPTATAPTRRSRRWPRSTASARRRSCCVGRPEGLSRAAEEHDPDRLRQNADIFSFALDDADMAAIKAGSRDGVHGPWATRPEPRSDARFAAESSLRRRSAVAAG